MVFEANGDLSGGKTSRGDSLYLVRDEPGGTSIFVTISHSSSPPAEAACALPVNLLSRSSSGIRWSDERQMAFRDRQVKNPDGSTSRLFVACFPREDKIVLFALVNEKYHPTADNYFQWVSRSLHFESRQPSPMPTYQPVYFVPFGKSWSLGANLPGFENLQDRFHGDGSRTFKGRNAFTGLYLTVNLKPMPAATSHSACRERWWREVKHSIERGSDVVTERADYSRLDFVLESELHQKTRNHGAAVFIAQDNFCNEVLLQKNAFRSGDEVQFNEIINTLGVYQGFSLSTEEILNAAEAFMILGSNHAMAIDAYEEILRRHTVNPLEAEEWRMAVYWLAVAHTYNGNFDRARHLLTSGLVTEPNNPLFHYGLARIHAQSNDAANSLTSLTQAYQNKGLLTGGRELGDPAKDPFFKSLMKDKNFKSAVQALVKGKNK